MRYILLLILNTPIVFLALLNLITKYKLKKISRERFRMQMLTWLGILTVLAGSFPLYNLLSGLPILSSQELSLFDIVQTTAIVMVIYIINNQRQKIETLNKRLQDLHQELSIKFSDLS